MIYRKVWSDYRDRIDLAVVSAAWPDFADRDSGRRHWLLGHVGPLSEAIPAKVAQDLDVPVIFANQCGETRTTIPVLGTQIKDRFAGQSSICDGRHAAPARAGREPSLLIAPITLHHQRGMKSWRSTSLSVPAASCSELARS
jgi:N-carbamoylputrescine amidase